MTITEFLEARIGEDEAMAREATGADPRWETMTEETPDGENIYYTVEELGAQYSTILDMSDTTQHGRNQAEHIARHDPSRVLAECAAKRAIMAAHRNQEDNDDPMAWIVASEILLRTLAAVYADHPDYQQEWALDTP